MTIIAKLFYNKGMEIIKFEKISVEDYMVFYNSLKEARINNNHGYYVDLDEPSHYKKTNNFLIHKGIGGYSIDNGNLIAVHKNPKLAQEANMGHIMHALMLSALRNGATKLDCYGEFLGETYMQFGKMAFNRAYNPEWPYKEEPNVYVMFKAINSLEELVKHQKDDSLLHLDEVEESLLMFDDYDELMQLRDKVLSKIERGNYSYDQIVNVMKSEEFLDE